MKDAYYHYLTEMTRMSAPKTVFCPNCATPVAVYENPAPTVDVLIYHAEQGIVLIKRRFEPLGWALPGGFVDYGETLAGAAVRESKEETGLDVVLQGLVGVYSNPLRDPRRHTITTAFWAKCADLSTLKGGDDAVDAVFFLPEKMPTPLVFEHQMIIADFFHILQENGHAAWR